MELSCSNINKILIFLQRTAFLIFSQKKFFLIFLKTKFRTLSARAQKTKNSLYFGKWNFLALILKEFIYFQKWNPSLFSPSSKNKKIHPEKISESSGNGSPVKTSYIFSKKAVLIFQETFYISGNRSPEKTS